MPKKIHPIRTLALDVRSQRCGFAVLEGQNRILEWGITHYRHTTTDGRAALARKRIASIITLFRPSVIALKYTPDKHGKRQYQPITDAITREARQQGAGVALVGRKELRSIFRQSGNTKYEIAAGIAGLFPELALKLPKVRTWYDREPRKVTIFDAISVGLAYFRCSGVVLENDPERPQARSPG